MDPDGTLVQGSNDRSDDWSLMGSQLICGYSHSSSLHDVS